jgi:hypothetical protein
LIGSFGHNSAKVNILSYQAQTLSARPGNLNVSVWLILMPANRQKNADERVHLSQNDQTAFTGKRGIEKRSTFRSAVANANSGGALDLESVFQLSRRNSVKVAQHPAAAGLG